jgi:glycosyltransferase involved in cell wall biosynthesis
MTQMPQISVAIPLFNKAAYVAESVKSALSQSFADFEIIVVDDGSTDGGIETLGQFSDQRLRIIRQDNAGPAAARNRAIAQARAPFVAFLDADDVWLPDHLLHLSELQKRFPQAMLFGNAFVESASDKVSVPPTEPIQYRLIEDFFSESAFAGAPFYTSSCMVSRARSIEVGCFPVGDYCGEDIALWILIAADAPVAVSNYIGCQYRRNSGSLSYQSSYRLAEPICISILAKMLASRSDWPAERRNAAQEYYNRLALVQCLDCLRMGDVKAAKNFLKLSARTQAHRKRWMQAKFMTSIPHPIRSFVFQFRRQS